MLGVPADVVTDRLAPALASSLASPEEAINPYTLFCDVWHADGVGKLGDAELGAAWRLADYLLLRTPPPASSSSTFPSDGHKALAVCLAEVAAQRQLRCRDEAARAALRAALALAPEHAVAVRTAVEGVRLREEDLRLCKLSDELWAAATGTAVGTGVRQLKMGCVAMRSPSCYQADKVHSPCLQVAGVLQRWPVGPCLAYH